VIDEANIREELARDFESGRQHPLAFFQHLAKHGEEERARLVAEVGPDYLKGRERLEFHHLVRYTYPDIREGEDAEHQRQLQKAYEENAEEVGSHLKDMVEERRNQRLSQPFTPSVGWNVPPKDGISWTPRKKRW
jgi:hypothetical protein